MQADEVRLRLRPVDPYFFIPVAWAVWLMDERPWNGIMKPRTRLVKHLLCSAGEKKAKKKTTAALWRRDTFAEETDGTVSERLDILSHFCLLHWINYILAPPSVLLSYLEPQTCFFCCLCGGVMQHIHPSIHLSPADGTGQWFSSWLEVLSPFGGARLQVWVLRAPKTAFRSRRGVNVFFFFIPKCLF